MSRIDSLTYEEASRRYRYEPETGRIIFRECYRKSRVGSEARSYSTHGYIRLTVAPHGLVHGHRLAWLLHYGKWPENGIDHINGVRDDNRIANLREATPALNAQNKRKPPVSNSSGYMGVALSRITKDGRKRWLATVMKGGKHYRFGTHDTAEAAYEAYLAGKRQLHEGCTL